MAKKKKENRGGSRPGSGRPKTGRKVGVTIYLLQDVIDAYGGYKEVRKKAEALFPPIDPNECKMCALKKEDFGTCIFSDCPNT